MSISISGSSGVSSTNTQGQIDRIEASVKGLRKQIQSLQKQLRESTDANEQKILTKEIMDLQRQIQMQEQQIANIQQQEQQKQEQRDKINGTKAS